MSENTEKITEPNYDLRKFQLTRVLQNNTKNKSIALLGKFPNVSDSDAAIVLLEKKAFQETDVQTEAKHETEEANGASEQSVDNTGFFAEQLKVHTEFINNIYGSFQCTPSMKLSAIKTTVVYPATDKHIEKYSVCQKFVIQETPELYGNVTLPYIGSSQFSLEWVYNILEHKQETERIVFEDADAENGFVLLPDLKWDGHTTETLYLLAIVHKRDIKSLRDLRAEHLPMLRNIRQNAAKAIEQKYGLSATQLRMYFHYQPSFYHLHIHINPLRNDAPGIWCEKSHMLDAVINNLELMPDYYEKSTLPFVLYDGNKLLSLYEEKLSIRPKKRCSEKANENDDDDDVAKKRLKIEEEQEKTVANETNIEAN